MHGRNTLFADGNSLVLSTRLKTCNGAFWNHCLPSVNFKRPIKLTLKGAKGKREQKLNPVKYD